MVDRLFLTQFGLMGLVVVYAFGFRLWLRWSADQWGTRRPADSKRWIDPLRRGSGAYYLFPLTTRPHVPGGLGASMGSSDRQEQFQVEWNEERAWRAVKRELSDLTGGSGHLSSYILDRDTFEITADGPSRFTWAVTGYLLTEFDHDLPPESLHGILSFHDDGEDVARAIREKE